MSIPCKFEYRDGSQCDGQICEVWMRKSTGHFMALCDKRGSHGKGYARGDGGAYAEELGWSGGQLLYAIDESGEFEKVEVEVGWGAQERWALRPLAVSG